MTSRTQAIGADRLHRVVGCRRSLSLGWASRRRSSCRLQRDCGSLKGKRCIARRRVRKTSSRRGRVAGETVIRSRNSEGYHAMAGDTAKAKAAYKDFLTLWKDADPDSPSL